MTDVNSYFTVSHYHWLPIIFVIFHWPPTEPLNGALKTLRFRGTPTEKHCNTFTFVKVRRVGRPETRKSSAKFGEVHETNGYQFSRRHSSSVGSSRTA